MTNKPQTMRIRCLEREIRELKNELESLRKLLNDERHLHAAEINRLKIAFADVIQMHRECFSENIQG